MQAFAPLSFDFVGYSSFSPEQSSATLRKPLGIRQMAAMLKKALSVVAALLFAATVSAAGPELRPDHPDTYVVKKGDTLWAISGRFLKSPWYWPEIWQANPQIDNPHLIYPGDVISLVYIDGQPRLMVNGESPSEVAPDVGPKMREEGRDDAIPPLPLSSIQSFLSRPRILSKEEYEAAPYVAAMEENRVIAADQQLIYVRRLDDSVARGQQFVVAHPTLKYSTVPDGWLWQKDKRRDKSEAWSVSDQWHHSMREWIASRGADVLGYELEEVGTAIVSSTGDPATLYVTYSDREIRKGDLLLPAEEASLPLNFYPHAPKAVPADSRVIGISGDFDHAGPNDVVLISRGAQDGIEVGEVYSVYQPGETITDEVAYPEGTARRFFNPRDKNMTLPEEFIGHVMIFRTFDRVSYGLIMNGVRPVLLGAELREPTDL
jgi:hypothetical protein